MTKTFSQFICGVFIVILLFGCGNKIYNLKSGDGLPSNKEGLLAGKIKWEQGGQPFSSKPSFMIVENDTNKTYSHNLEGNEFRIVLPSGKYHFTKFVSLNPDIETTAGRKASYFLPALINVITIPFGFFIIPFPATALTIEAPQNPIEIKENSITYVGVLSIDIPRPLPAGPITPDIQNIADEATLKDIQLQFPSIQNLEKHLLLPPKGVLSLLFNH